MRFTIVDSVDGTAKAVDCPGSAFWIVLEKFGFLDYQTKSFEEFISAHQDLPSVGIIPNAVARALRPGNFQSCGNWANLRWSRGPWTTQRERYLGSTSRMFLLTVPLPLRFVIRR